MYRSIIEYGGTVREAWSKLKRGEPFIVYDTETTGLNPEKDRIITFSAVKLVWNEGRFVVSAKLDAIMNPECKVGEKASQVNGFTEESLKIHPAEDAVFPAIYEFMGSDSPFVGSYNGSKFDDRFMDAMYQRNGERGFFPSLHLDGLMMAREKLSLESYKLQSVYDSLGFTEEISFHESADDVKATVRVIACLLHEYEGEDEEEEAEDLPVLRVYGAKVFNPSYKVRRIYVTTYPKSKTYYDLSRKQWISDVDCNLKQLRSDVLLKYNALHEADLFKALAAGN